MSDDEASEYARLMKLANDVSLTDEIRAGYRAQLEALTHKKRAFKFAAKQTPPAPPKP
jgi:hypothetical protein